MERQPVEFLGRRFADLMRDAHVALAGSEIESEVLDEQAHLTFIFQVR